MSAETAVATKSKYLINSFSGSLNLVCNACINLNPIPHPQSSLNGYSQSSFSDLEQLLHQELIFQVNDGHTL